MKYGRAIFIFLFFFSVNLNSQDNYLFFLNNTDDATLARIKIIESARKEILISYFIFEDDPFGLVSLDILLLQKELHPDLKIKILLDASANGIDKSLLYYLEQKGIEIKEFHPLPKLIVPWNKISIKNFFNALNNLNYRMHDKLILADSDKLIVGGRNIENSYYGLNSKNFHDRDLFFHSKSLVRDVRRYYYQLWNSSHVQKITYYDSDKHGKRSTRMINKLKNIRNYVLSKSALYKKLISTIDPKTKGVKFSNVLFLNSYDEVKNKFNPEYLSTALYYLTINTKKSFIIETPYLLPTQRFYKLLRHFKQKNIKMQFVTNSFCSTDAMPVAAAYDNEKPKIESLGVELYEYTGPGYLHAKSAVFDDSLALVGSYNMDPRSAYINTELVFVIEDKSVAKELKKLILEDMENCVNTNTATENTFGGYYDCEKSRIDIMTYVIFKFLTKFSWLYNLF